jgi:hypothetical protein
MRIPRWNFRACGSGAEAAGRLLINFVNILAENRNPSNACRVGFSREDRQEPRGVVMWRRWLGHTEVNPTEARQGYLDRPVLIVLVVSLALIVMAFGLLLLPTLI